MNITKLVVEFVTVFAVALVTTAIVTFLWNIIGHGASVVDWETSFRLAIIFGIILTWVKSREIKEKQGFQKSETTERRKSCRFRERVSRP
jgi:hypothetical protein